MKKISTFLILCLVGFTATSQAGWVLLDNFDSYAAGDAATVTGGVWSSDTDDSTTEITASGTLLISKLAGSGGWDGSYTDISGTGASVAVGETSTFFWQVKVNTGWPEGDWVYDCMMGLSPDVSNIDQVDAWQDFAVMPFVNNGAPDPFINANGPDAAWWAPMTNDTWTNVWVVVNNDETDPTFDLYYSTGLDAAVLVSGNADWRGSESGIGPGVDLNAFGFMAAGWDLNDYDFDNVYYADGMDLTNPIPEPATMALLGLGGLLLRRKRT